jgi:hypothetical protein
MGTGINYTISPSLQDVHLITSLPLFSNVHHQFVRSVWHELEKIGPWKKSLNRQKETEMGWQ